MLYKLPVVELYLLSVSGQESHQAINDPIWSIILCVYLRVAKACGVARSNGHMQRSMTMLYKLPVSAHEF